MLTEITPWVRHMLNKMKHDHEWRLQCEKIQEGYARISYEKYISKSLNSEVCWMRNNG